MGLKDQVFQRLGIVMTSINELIGTGSKMITMGQVPIREAADYAGADADMTLRLVEPVQAELQQHWLDGHVSAHRVAAYSCPDADGALWCGPGCQLLARIWRST